MLLAMSIKKMDMKYSSQMLIYKNFSKVDLDLLLSLLNLEFQLLLKIVIRETNLTPPYFNYYKNFSKVDVFSNACIIVKLLDHN